MQNLVFTKDIIEKGSIWMLFLCPVEVHTAVGTVFTVSFLIIQHTCSRVCVMLPRLDWMVIPAPTLWKRAYCKQKSHSIISDKKFTVLKEKPQGVMWLQVHQYGRRVAAQVTVYKSIQLIHARSYLFGSEKCHSLSVAHSRIVFG